MRRMTTTARRGGFTLVELLLVIAILAVLAALGTAAYYRARAGQEVRGTEATVGALRAELDKRWKAVLDDARQDAAGGRIPAAVSAFAGGDKDRTLAVWSYCKLKNEFPTTVAEACNPVFVPVLQPGGSGFTFAGVTQVLSPKVVFTSGFKVAGKTSVQGVQNPNDPDPLVEQRRTAYESAACLHWVLTKTATRGAVSGAEELGQQVGELPNQFLTFAGATVPQSYTPRAFRDSFGQPLVFLRHGLNAEVNDRPYLPSKPTVGATNRDPLDPRGTLADLTKPAVWTVTHVDAFWKALYPKASDNLPLVDATGMSLGGTAAASQHAVLPDGTSGTPKLFRDVLQSMYYPTDTTTSGTGPSTSNPPKGAWNWQPAIVSGGADKSLDANLGQGDDILSYRLAREGNKGN